MNKKQRRTELYGISLIDKQTKYNYDGKIRLKDLLKNFIEKNKTTDPEKHIFKISGTNDLVYWYEDYHINDMSNVIELKFYYSIYNKKVDIVNVTTLAKTKNKDKNEGDKERQHALIKYYPNVNRCVLVFERIVGAISISSIEQELNKFIAEDYAKVLSRFEINIKPIPNLEFIKELEKLKRISLLKVTVDMENTYIDEDVLFSENNISRKEVDLIYKPTLGSSFGISRIKQYYSKFNENSGKIKRIVIEGKNKDGKIKLDTQGIKMAKYIETELAFDGLVSSEDIFKKYNNFILNDFEEYLMDMVVEEIAVERED